MPVFISTASATHVPTGTITVHTSIFRAGNKDEAAGAALRTMREARPLSEGWSRHEIVLHAEISKEALLEFADAARPESDIPEADRI